MSSNLSRGLQSVVDRTSIEDGKVRFAIDSARLFFDTKNERVEITDFVRGLTRAEILALESPLTKVYLPSDGHSLLVYDFYNEKWMDYSGGNEERISALENKVVELTETLAKYERVIEILEQQQNNSGEDSENGGSE